METSQSNAKEIVADFLSKQPLMQVATSDSNNMWIATVWYAIDKDLNIYFLSKETREHSQHIAINSKVTCAITGQYTKGPGEKIQGVQLSGVAKKLTGLSVLTGYKVYASKWPQLYTIGPVEAFKGNAAGIHMYSIAPERIVLFDEINFPDEPRIDINL